MIDWISHTIVIPLFPLLAALVIAVLKGENIQVYTIFGALNFTCFLSLC